MAKGKTTTTTKSKLTAYKDGSHKAGDTIYTFKAGDEVTVKKEHLDIMKNLGAFKKEQ